MRLHGMHSGRMTLAGSMCLALLLGPAVTTASASSANGERDSVTIRVCKEVRKNNGDGDNRRFDFRIREVDGGWRYDFSLRDGDCRRFRDLEARQEYRIREFVPNRYRLREIKLSRRCDWSRVNEDRAAVRVEVREGDTCRVTFVDARNNNR
jgi:hypothetical protein